MKLITRCILLFSLLSVSYFSAHGQSLSISADVTTGCSPLVVHFTGSGPSGDSYQWNFGNGAPLSPLFPMASTSYTSPGTYTCTLKDLTTGATKTITITVYPSPTVSFTASATTICPGASVTFTSTTVGGVPGPVTTLWAFGDGYTGSGSPISHTYTASGDYNVTLTATNADGCVASATISDYIHVLTPPVASFSASTTHFCHAPGVASFTATPSGTGPFTYSWSFGDGSPGSTSPDPTHSYGSPGSYTVTLIVTDSHGCEDSVSIPGYIVINDLVASFTDPDTACVNTEVIFTNTSSSYISSTWTYGDGHSGTSGTGFNEYTTAGSYTVSLVIFDGYCYDTVSHPIIILPAATATFTITPTDPCPAPATASFTATAPAGSTITWHFGDGSSGSGTPVSHTYGSNGVYTVQMIVINAHGCIDTFTQTYTIHDLIFEISHLIDTTGCVPLTVNFISYALTSVPGPSIVTYPYAISSYTWNFGDGSPTSSSATPSHTYTAVGVYHVTVTIITANGCTATATTTVIVGTPPVITVTATPRNTCYHNNDVLFTATIVSGPVGEYFWQFGDSTHEYTTTDTVTHHYVYPGIFTVTVTPSYNGCDGPPVVLTDYITIDSPMAIIHDTVLCTPVNTVEFGDFSLGDNTRTWIFGDGSPNSTIADPTHTYPAPVIYTATLATYNIASGCRDTANVTVDLTRPVVTFTTPDTAICRDSYILFTSTVTGGTASGYGWSGGGSSANFYAPTLLDTFHTTGIYTIVLTITDQNGCEDTYTRNNYILVAKPVAHFTASPDNGCWQLTTTFTNTSTDVAGTFYTNFVWAFGDGTTSTVTTPTVTHTFSLVGTMTTTLTVTDNIGCKDTVSLPLVTVYRPTASFTASTSFPCLSSSVNFTNTSTPVVSYSWMFGDGVTSTLASPSHLYADTGHYTVTLIVTDAHGCKDTATYVNFIYVTKPHASFYMDDSIAICPPLTVHFTNTSTGAISYSWTFGDGTSYHPTIPNPVNLYIAPGYDTVLLIATNAYGCSDTAIGHVNIFGYAGALSYTPDSGCAPLTVFFTADVQSVASIIWDFSDGVTSSASLSDTISHNYLLPGAYVPKLIISNLTGCENSSTGIDTIKVDGVTPGFTTHPNPVCIGDSINFIDTSHSYWSHIVSWDWTYGGTSSNLASPTETYTATGSYPVTLAVTDAWGCMATTSGDVSVYPLPIITISPDTIICVGDAATLYGYGGVSYTWSGPGTMSCTNCNPTMVSPIVISQYTVTGTDEHGCMNTDTTSVFLKTLTISRAWGDTAICFGQETPLYDSGGTKYTWLPPVGLDNAYLADPIASPPNSVTYMAIAQLGSCTPDTNYVTVIVHPLPTVNAGPDQNLLAGSLAQLTATGTLIYTYLWSPSNTLSCDTCYNPVASMTVNTTYTIKVSTIFGCTSSDSVNIRLYCDNSQLFIPNTFTPNGDGENDIFYPRGQGVSIIKSFRIYNRWGELMFERSGIHLNDASNAWDGTYNGGTPRPDVYVWVIDATCDTGEPLFLKGDVTIIR